MSYLLDTNVISETIKREPNQVLMSWLKSISSTHFYISVISLGEIRKGTEKLPESLKRQQLEAWLEIDLPRNFLGRIINIDSEISNKWGYILAKNEAPALDAMIAASAIVNNLKLVTRNTKDFKNIPGLEIINPWNWSN